MTAQKTPIYSEAKQNLKLFGSASNTGLKFDKFFDQWQKIGKEWKVEDGKKQEYLESVKSIHCSDKELLESQSRQHQLATSQGAITLCLKASDAFITGMGNAHPVENGIRWHHTLGVPYLPATGVKGLLRQWCEQWQKEGLLSQNIEKFFGSSSDAKSSDAKNLDIKSSDKTDKAANVAKAAKVESVGKLIFLDALPIEKPTLRVDVMTPHYDKWYSDGHRLTEANPYSQGEAQNDAHKIVPAGWHSPVPIPYLVVEEITLAVRVMPHPSLSKSDWQKIQGTLEKDLQEAFATIGAGAKTAVGYGYFEIDEEATETINMSPMEKKLKNALKEKGVAKGSEIGEAVDLISQGYFGKENSGVAEVIKVLMESTDQDISKWTTTKPTDPKFKKALKAYDRTQKVIKAINGETQ